MRNLYYASEDIVPTNIDRSRLFTTRNISDIGYPQLSILQEVWRGLMEEKNLTVKDL